tara:strand:+ start:3224 stop:4177 length:954 start_codon:yes stop_codon:yes gene_type:complete
MATVAKAVPISDALDAMRDSDDSIAEIDAMIPRLLKMKKQLIAQKEYIEVAVKDSQEPKNGNAQNARAAGRGGLVVDYRVKLYKHQSKIQRLTSNGDGTAGVTTGVLAIGIPPAGADDGYVDTSGGPLAAGANDKDVLRSVKSGGTKAAADDIFKADQKIVPSAAVEATDEEKAAGSPLVFASVDLECTKNFLIGVNAILTHPNDITSSGLSTDGTNPVASANYVISIKPGGNTTTAATYSAGGKHALTDGTLRGLLMLTNTGVDAAIMDFSPAVIPVDAAMKAHAAFMSTDATKVDGTAGAGGRLDANKKIRGFGL